MTQVLLVDDDPDSLEALAPLLERRGLTVESACGAGPALVALGQQTFDILLTDVLMPGLDGTQLASLGRRIQPGLTVIAMSAGAQPVTARTALKIAEGYGVDGVIEKPVDAGKLIELIDTLNHQRFGARGAA